MNGNSWPADAPSPRSNVFWCLGLANFDEDKAAANFERRFGYPPEWIIANHLGLAWLGPIEVTRDNNT